MFENEAKVDVKRHLQHCKNYEVNSLNQENMWPIRWRKNSQINLPQSKISDEYH